MRVTSLLALLPLAIAAPATKNAPRSRLPDLTALEWSSIQSGFVDRVWSGISDLSGWSLHQADDLVEAMRHSADSEDESKTIWKQLKGDEQFSKIVKAIEFADVKDIFDDDKITFTFFAPNNDALTPPKGHGHPDHHHDHDHHGHHHHESIFADLEKNPSLATVSSLLESNSFLANDDDDDHKKKREIFKKIVQKVLQYHSVMKHSLTAQELAQNSTVATVLKADDGSYGGLHRRIKVEKQLLPPSVNLNFYAKVISADHKASNGIFHVINHPLIPPPSLFDVSYQFPDFFSTLVSATYGSHGVHYLDYHYDRETSKPGEPHFKGTGLATLFSPTNSAFGVLPPGLKFYLFSPFGERALVKVLAYHYVPHTLLLSELLYHEKDHHHHHDKKVEEVEYFTMGDDPSYHKEFEVETGLPNATLHIVVDKTKFLPVEGAVKTTIKVNGQTTLAVDAQARNGAFHPIGKLLVPPHHHHDENGVDVAHLDSWENWEEWLPAFAAAE